MLEKAKAPGNAGDRGSKFASPRKMADFQRKDSGLLKNTIASAQALLKPLSDQVVG